MFKRILKRVPVIRRIYPSIIKKIFKSLNIEEINYEFFKLKLKGNINEPMDKEIFFFSEYENSQINFLLQYINLSKFDFFIDVGANSGLYSMIIAKHHNNMQIKSFEPIKETIKKFKENIKLNNNMNNIEIFEFGLSNNNSKLLMKSLKKKNYIQTGGFGVAKNSDYLNNLHTQYAEFKKGDDVINLFKKNLIVKIDTEGHEQEVIEGLINTIKNNNILLQIEIFDKNYNKVNNLLKNNNFKKIHKINSDKKTDYYYKNY
jgi:FkbM family methyltransferase